MAIYNIYRGFKEFSVKKQIEPIFFNVEIIDNKAQWIYNGNLYSADIVNDKVDYTTKRKISLS
jgi:hypothetical protein